MVHMTITPAISLDDEPLHIQVTGLQPYQEVTLRSSMVDLQERRWEAWATFQAGESGEINVDTQAPLTGTYEGVDGMGLMWSMRPLVDAGTIPAIFRPLDKPLPITVEVYVNQDSVARESIQRLFVREGVQIYTLQHKDRTGIICIPAGQGPFPGVIVLGGTGGEIAYHEATRLASHGIATLALAYYGIPPLPPALIRIPLEYFLHASQWFQRQPFVQSGGIGILGTSKGAEAALLVGTKDPTIRAIVSLSGGVALIGGYTPTLTKPSPDWTIQEGFPSWSYQGQGISYFRPRWWYGLSGALLAVLTRRQRIGKLVTFLDRRAYHRAVPPIEQIQGPILFLAGSDDQVTPAVQEARWALERLKAKQHPYPDDLIVYPHAGHALAGSYVPQIAITITVPIVKLRYRLGGTPAGNVHARIDALQQAIRFFKQHITPPLSETLQSANIPSNEKQHPQNEEADFFALAKIAQGQDLFDDAERYLLQALEHDRVVQDRHGEGMDLGTLGQVAQTQGRLEDAKHYLQQALEIHREMQDRQGEGVDLSTLGQIAQAQGRLEDAERYLQQALEIARKVQDRHGEGVDLSTLGQIAQAQGRLEDAERYLQQAIEIDRTLKDQQGEGADLLTLGMITQNRGHFDVAEQYLLLSLDIHRSIHDLQGEGVVLTTLGQVTFALKQGDIAEEYLQQAWKLHREVGDRRSEAVDMTMLGQIAQAIGNLDAANRYLQLALKIDRDLFDKHGEGVDMTALGQIALLCGQLDEAEHYLQQSLAINNEFHDQQSAGDNLNTLGNIALIRGQLDQAEQYLHQSLDIHRALHALSEEGTDLSLLGQLALAHGKVEEAEAMLQLALQQYRLAQDQEGEGAALGWLGLVAYRRGQVDSAEQMLEDALRRDREIQFHRGESRVLRTLAQVAETRQQLDTAESRFRASLNIAIGLQSAVEYTRTQHELGRFLLQHGRGDPEEGCRLLAEAAQRYALMQVPGAEAISQLLQQYGCPPT